MTLPQPKPPTGFRKQVLALLGESYGDKTLVLCPTVFVRLLHGDHKAAILLSQVLYWGDRTKDPEGWFYKSYAEWQLETGLSEAQVRRIVNGDPRVRSTQVTLRDLGVETVLKKVKRTGAPTLHYRVNQARFLAALEAFLRPSDPQPCSGSIPNNGVDEPLPVSAMNPAQSTGSWITSEITPPENSAADQDHQTHTSVDEDSDLAIFLAFEDRFGRLKEPAYAALRSELERLGMSRVGQVLERCATRGRSWNYVLRALANERPTSSEGSVDWAESASLYQETEPTPPLQPKQAGRELPRSERIDTPWPRLSNPPGTVHDAWDAAFQQLEGQLDRASFETGLRGATLVDFEPETATFVLVARTAFGRDLLHGRLARTLKRILSDVYGQAVEVRVLDREAWLEQGKTGLQIA